MEDSTTDVLVVVMVVMVVVMVVAVGRGIVVLEVMDEDYLMEVEVVEEDCLMNNPARFGT